MLYTQPSITFTPPPTATSFRVVVHNASISDLSNKEIQLEQGNRKSAFKPNYKDTPEALAYIKEGLLNDTNIDGGIVSTSILKVGAKKESGVWVEKAGINGAGTGSLTPRFYSGGDLSSAVRRINETINKVPTLGEKASYTVTEDGRVFMFAGYVGDFELINGVMSTESMEIGRINDIPRFRIKDISNGRRVAVDIGDFNVTSPLSLAGTGNINATPAYAEVVTDDEDEDYWVTAAGVTRTQSMLSSSLSPNTTYQASFNIIAINQLGSLITPNENVTNSGSEIDLTYSVRIINNNGRILSEDQFIFSGSGNYDDSFYKDVEVSLSFATGSDTSGVYVKISMISGIANDRWNTDPIRCYASSKKTLAIKNNTSITLTSGIGTIEICRGFNAIFGANKYFKLEDKSGVKFIDSRSDAIMLSSNGKYGLEWNDSGIYVYRDGVKTSL